MAFWRLLESRRVKAFLGLAGWSVAVAISFWTSGHPLAALAVSLLATAFSIMLFWPDIKRLRFAYPKDAQLESPFWLYIFGLVGLLLPAAVLWQTYQQASKFPSLLTDAELSSSYIQGKHLKIEQLAGADNVIQGRTFEDSWIYGPATLYMAGRDDIGDSHFEAPIDNVFLPVPPGTHGVVGVLVLRDCKFRRCNFVNVSIVATPEDVDKFKKTAGQPAR